MGQVTIVGNLTDDPELRYTPNGAAVAKFRVAVNRRYKDQSGEWKDGDTSYFTVNAWRTLAENVAETLTRGANVIVSDAAAIGPRLRGATARVDTLGGCGGGDWSASSGGGDRVSVGVGTDEETPLDAG